MDFQISDEMKSKLILLSAETEERRNEQVFVRQQQNKNKAVIRNFWHPGTLTDAQHAARDCF